MIGVSSISGVRINSIPYEVEEFIEKLDEKKRCAKNWYHVARKLGLSMDEADRLKREESPTLALISKLKALGDCCYFKKICLCTVSVRET